MAILLHAIGNNTQGEAKNHALGSIVLCYFNPSGHVSWARFFMLDIVQCWPTLGVEFRTWNGIGTDMLPGLLFAWGLPGRHLSIGLNKGGKPLA